jgi:hypothetical protein
MVLTATWTGDEDGIRGGRLIKENRARWLVAFWLFAAGGCRNRRKPTRAECLFLVVADEGRREGDGWYDNGQEVRVAVDCRFSWDGGRTTMNRWWKLCLADREGGWRGKCVCRLQLKKIGVGFKGIYMFGPWILVRLLIGVESSIKLNLSFSFGNMSPSS